MDPEEQVTLGGHSLPAGPAQEAYVKRGFFPKVKRVVRKIPFAENAVAMFYAAFDPATPKWAKRTAIGALAYFIMPIDLIPDMLIVAGYTDDASILAFAVAVLAKHVTPGHHEKARAWLAEKT
jgi:uncharacterized membrane protein YkvA (DUF1232 family)